MRVLLQRVSNANVQVDGAVVGEIGQGLLALVCAMDGDTSQDVAPLASKISKLRIFADDAGKMNRSVLDISGSVLVVSQFTLAADTSRGNRPGFSRAAPPADGEAMYLEFAQSLRDIGLPVATGRFGADMKVALTNDGPVTIWMDTQDR